uniref:Uncharacterized protein n=1 Tax=Arundo donax TaxID=35708 RepID=A0A0A9BAA7_ARUDO
MIIIRALRNINIKNQKCSRFTKYLDETK